MEALEAVEVGLSVEVRLPENHEMVLTDENFPSSIKKSSLTSIKNVSRVVSLMTTETAQT